MIVFEVADSPYTYELNISSTVFFELGKIFRNLLRELKDISTISLLGDD
jgi:hypothetical protein